MRKSTNAVDIDGLQLKHKRYTAAPYSPGMVPCDLSLFQRLKTPLKGYRFDSRQDIIQNATEQFHAIPKRDRKSVV